MNTLDARGLSCPEPVIMIKKAFDAIKAANSGTIPAGTAFGIMVDNRTSVENITRFGEHEGLKVSVSKIQEDFTVRLEK